MDGQSPLKRDGVLPSQRAGVAAFLTIAWQTGNCRDIGGSLLHRPYNCWNDGSRRRVVNLV